ncbi:MAG: uroporphyrinogen decarboxylase family protein [Candidatus Bathyarchaeia archaeon]
MGLQALMDRVLKALEDPRYDGKRDLWRRFSEGKEVERPPVTVFSRTYDWAQELGFDLLRYYEDPEYYLEANLKILLYRHERIHDDSLLSPSISIDFGAAFEPSLLGVGVVFRPDTTPWPAEPIVRDEEDLKKLRFPDVYRSGLMPRAHRFHDAIRKIVGENLRIEYRPWTRGPWGVLVHMMGWQNALLSLIKKPSLIEKLLGFITEARMVWEVDWGRFLGREVVVSSLSNDEVDAKVLSPKNYRELVLPCEKRLAEFYKEGISYFHSCGNIGPFLPSIKEIAGLRIVQISPWTSIGIAKEVLGNSIAMERWIHPEDLILDEERTRAKFVRILQEGAENRVTIVCAGAVKDTIRWLKAIKPVLETWSYGREKGRA